MKHKLLFAAILVMTVFAGQNVKAQNTVFGYTYLGTTLYYSIDSTGNAAVVEPRANVPNVTYLGDSLFIDDTALDTLVLECTTPPSLGVVVM